VRADACRTHSSCTGRRASARERFARQLAALCLCEPASAGPAPCGACRGCRLATAGTHPDLHVIQPEEGKVALSIDQIRELSGDLVLLPHLASLKIAIIRPAESMTPSAANALLKTLEEPAGATLLLLVSARPSALPPTVRSRCQAVRFRPPPAALARAWLAERREQERAWDPLLELAGGAPLAALALSESGAAAHVAELERDLQGIVDAKADPLAVATQWGGRGSRAVVELAADPCLRPDTTEDAAREPGSRSQRGGARLAKLCRQP
jgi:DNA polymerase-3 subunit delta'